MRHTLIKPRRLTMTRTPFNNNVGKSMAPLLRGTRLASTPKEEPGCQDGKNRRVYEQRHSNSRTDGRLADLIGRLEVHGVRNQFLPIENHVLPGDSHSAAFRQGEGS